MAQEEQLAGISFKDIGWLQNNELNTETILDYFSISPFYDRTCNNEVLKMQTRYNNLDELHHLLSQMKGIEYDLIHHQYEPIPMFIIRKERRLNGQDILPLALYYILEGTIYPIPDLYTILGTRMRTCLFHLDHALQDISQYARYHPSKGYSWRGMTHLTSQYQHLRRGGLSAAHRKEANEFRQRIDSMIQHVGYTPSPGHPSIIAPHPTSTPHGTPLLGTNMVLTPSSSTVATVATTTIPSQSLSTKSGATITVGTTTTITNPSFSTNSSSSNLKRKKEASNDLKEPSISSTSSSNSRREPRAQQSSANHPLPISLSEIPPSTTTMTATTTHVTSSDRGGSGLLRPL